MNILSLYQRIGDSAKRRHVAALISRGNFSFICIQETKREILYDFMLSSLWG